MLEEVTEGKLVKEGNEVRLFQQKLVFTGVLVCVMWECVCVCVCEG